MKSSPWQTVHPIRQTGIHTHIFIYLTLTSEHILYTFIYLLWIPPPAITICRHSTQFSRFVYTILLLPLAFVIFDLIFIYIYAFEAPQWAQLGICSRTIGIDRATFRGWYMWRMSNARCCLITYTHLCAQLICIALCMTLI